MTSQEITFIRDYYSLPPFIPDRWIEDNCPDTLGLSLYRLRLAVDKFKKELKEALLE